MFTTVNDRQLRTHVVKGESALDMVLAAREACEGVAAADGETANLDNREWTGRRFSSWAALQDSFGKPWAEGQKVIGELREEIEQMELPAPTSRRRRARWSEAEGDVDVDRVLGREPAFFREVKRTRRGGPTTIAITLHVGGSCQITHRQMFWRGAAAVVLADMIEAAGYACEIWIWNRALRGHQDRNNSFKVCKVKEAGDPLDIDTLACVVSPWFYRTVMFGVMHKADVRPTSGCGSTQYELNGCEKHMDLTPGMRMLHMPAKVFKKSEAIEAAQELLAQLNQGE